MQNVSQISETFKNNWPKTLDRQFFFWSIFRKEKLALGKYDNDEESVEHDKDVDTDVTFVEWEEPSNKHYLVVKILNFDLRRSVKMIWKIDIINKNS